MPKSSSSSANVPGTGSPFAVRCARTRDVEKPSAPASIASRTIRPIASMSVEVACSLRMPRSPITWVRTATWPICVATSIEKARVSRKSRYSGNDSQAHGIPASSTAPGTSSTYSIVSMSIARCSGRAGAKPMPQLPMTTVVTPWPADGSSTSSNVTCPS